MNQHKKLQLVLLTIQETPEAANDDALLMSKIWEKEGWNPDLSLYENLKRVSRPETITRRRRQAHQLGLIEYCKKADKDRAEAFKNEQEANSDHNTTQIWGRDTWPVSSEVAPKSKTPSPAEGLKKLKQVNIFNLEEK